MLVIIDCLIRLSLESRRLGTTWLIISVNWVMLVSPEKLCFKSVNTKLKKYDLNQKSDLNKTNLIYFILFIFLIMIFFQPC